MLAGGAEAGTRTLGRDQRRGGAIAEQGGGHHIAPRIVAKAEGEGAELDDEIKHARTRMGLGEVHRPRQPDHAAGTAQAEDRQAFDTARQAQPLDDQSVETGGRHAGRGNGDDRVDVAGVESRPLETSQCRLSQEFDGMFSE